MASIAGNVKALLAETKAAHLENKTCMDTSWTSSDGFLSDDHTGTYSVTMSDVVLGFNSLCLEGACGFPILVEASPYVGEQ